MSEISNKIIYRIAFICSILILFLQQLNLFALSGEEIGNKWLNNKVNITVTFQIQDTNGNSITYSKGCGFVIGENNNSLYIITANHVFDPKLPSMSFLNASVYFYEDKGNPIECKKLELDKVESMDLALLMVKKPDGYLWERKYITRDYNSNDKVWYIGPDWEIPTDTVLGTIENFDEFQHILIINGFNNIEEGYSGAPVFTAIGIAGMLIVDGKNVYALGIDIIRQIVIKKWNYPWNMEEYKPSPTPQPETDYHFTITLSPFIIPLDDKNFIYGGLLNCGFRIYDEFKFSIMLEPEIGYVQWEEKKTYPIFLNLTGDYININSFVFLNLLLKLPIKMKYVNPYVESGIGWLWEITDYSANFFSGQVGAGIDVCMDWFLLTFYCKVVFTMLKNQYITFSPISNAIEEYKAEIKSIAIIGINFSGRF